MSYEPRSLNPSIMEKRINDLEKSSGGDGSTPYTPPPYSLEEVATGKTWLDGKMIYKRGFEIGTYFADSFKDITTMSAIGAEKLTDSVLLAGSHAGYPVEHIDINVNAGTIRFKSPYGNSSTQDINYVYLEYTKVTEE